jgi:hypothetical protein
MPKADVGGRSLNGNDLGKLRKIFLTVMAVTDPFKVTDPLKSV